MHVAASLIRPLLLLFTLFSSGPGEGERPPQGDGPPRPPAEAIDACSGKSSGDSCSFSGREGETVSGVCFTPESDKPLACRPSQPPGGQR
ncbi:hypothetical protein G6O69_20620 [Pseudenhygromyxa sp. WMMC2535]|uniref:hypothetical protein n=1 Tax=Pseudenhygromyxa sp. WMMC2535 TaxID=2712867 RepID=UPI0015527F15|nr:hypothetical protein [Pseudenhygromyxa sp. WMMC2535]NVB40259.1 hypothetical protein [Pseudenhygromyxa sp. WMMC2535]